MTGTRFNARVIRAPHGTKLSAKSWLTEAPLRMLMNNLDPDVAENPNELVVYGGIGRAARNWECFDKIVDTLKGLNEDETLLIQSGKPVGVFRTHKDAPRVLLANSNLVPHWATWEHFRELDAKGLMMYGQMTAGSWIYIGTQGIVQGTYETFVEAGRQHYGGNLKGRWILTGGLGGMGGAQPLAATMAGASMLAVECEPSRIERRLETRYLDTKAPSLDEALGLLERAKKDGKAISIGLLGNAAEIFPEILKRGVRPDMVTDQTSAHDPLNGYLPAGWSLAHAAGLRNHHPSHGLRTVASCPNLLPQLPQPAGHTVRFDLREADPVHAFMRNGVRPELLVQAAVSALPKEVQVVPGQSGRAVGDYRHLYAASILWTMRTDYVQRFLFENLDIRGRLVCLTGAWQRMLDGRHYPEDIAALLGHTTALNVLLGANQKGSGRVTLQVQGSGPVKLLVCDCTAELRIRGMAQYQRENVGSGNERNLLGDGRLAVTLEDVRSGQCYQSLVPLEGETLEEIFEHYLSQSEQTTAFLRLKADGGALCGLLLFGFAIQTDVRHIPTVVLDESRTADSRAVIAAFENTGNFRIIAHVNGRDALDGWIARGDAQAGIVVPEDLYRTTLTKDLKDWTQIFYQFGLGAAALKVIRD